MNKCMCCKVECGPVGEMGVVSLRATDPAPGPQGAWSVWEATYKLCIECNDKFRSMVEDFPLTAKSKKGEAEPWGTMADFDRKVVIPHLNRMRRAK